MTCGSRCCAQHTPESPCEMEVGCTSCPEHAVFVVRGRLIGGRVRFAPELREFRRAMNASKIARL